MTPIVTVVSDAFPTCDRSRTGIVPQSLAKLPGLEPEQSLRIEFESKWEARKAKTAFYTTAKRQGLTIRLSISDNVIRLGLRTQA